MVADCIAPPFHARPRAKLTPAQVRLARELYWGGRWWFARDLDEEPRYPLSDWTRRQLQRLDTRPTLAALAAHYGVRPTTLWSALTGETHRGTTRTTRHRWEPEAIADILARYAAGEVVRTIAASHNVTPCSIYALLHRHGDGAAGRHSGRPRPHDLAAMAARLAAGESRVQVAAAYGIHRETLARWLREAGIAVAPPQCPTIAPGGR